jgi:hypothetical protein
MCLSVVCVCAEKKKNDETGRVLFELEENFNRLQVRARVWCYDECV